ncbi:radical SAM/SPASM domain-containing protein [Thiolapillus sp.]
MPFVKNVLKYIPKLKIAGWANTAPRLSDDRSTTVSTAPLFHQNKKISLESLLNFYETAEHPKWPLEIFIEVSNVCDLQCAMCPTFSALSNKRFTSISARHRGFFDLNLIEDKLEEALKHALVVHAFGYGEPTLHPQFPMLLEKLGKYDVMVDFFTHGMHLTESLCAEVIKQKISKVTISFSGADQDDYENVYLGGDYEKILTGIRRLNQHKVINGSEYPLIVVNSLAFQHHVSRLPEFVQIMGEAGVNVIHLKPLQVFGKIKELYEHVSIYSVDQHQEILAEAKQIADKYNIILGTKEYEASTTPPVYHSAEKLSVPISTLKEIASIKRGGKEGLGEKTKKKHDIKVPRKEQIKYRYNKNIFCTEPFKTLYVSYEGSVYPCCFNTPSKLAWGDINKNCTTEIWQSDLMASVREHVINQQYPELLCNNCMETLVYPKRNPARTHAIHYFRWYEEKYGTPFSPKLLQKVQATPEWNEPLFEQLQNIAYNDVSAT